MREGVSGDLSGGGRMRNVVDYRLCDQVVTVYRRQGDSVLRRVFFKAFLDQRRSRDLNRKGGTESNAFLLVIPGDEQSVFIGDKVLPGEGPEIQGAQEWAAFIPANVPDLVVVSHAGVKRWQGRIVHTEAGGSVQRFTNLTQVR